MITCSKCGKQREATGFPRGVITPSPSGKDNVSQSVFGYCECGGYFSDLNPIIEEKIKKLYDIKPSLENVENFLRQSLTQISQEEYKRGAREALEAVRLEYKTGMPETVGSNSTVLELNKRIDKFLNTISI